MIDTLLEKLEYHLSGTVSVRGKDFVASPFRYPGGKFYALKYILPFLRCVDHDEFREPFVGGGNIFFAKEKCPYNWLNDLDDDLMITYRMIARSDIRVQLISRVIEEVASRDRHSEVKNIKPNDDFERAFRIYYLNRTSYCGIINKPAWGYQDGKSSPPKNWGKFIKYSGEKLEGVKLTTRDFEDVITAKARGKKVLMYLDPPYFHADQKRAYTKSFRLEDHYRLAEILRKTEYLFCLSYDDCPEIRKLYRWADIHEQSWLYNTANCKNAKRKLGNELIITNYIINKFPQQYSLNLSFPKDLAMRR